MPSKSVREMKVINVLNYCSSIVTVKTRNDNFEIPPSDGENPTILPLSFDEIEYINSNSNAFKDGLLRFPENLEKEIYEELRVVDWENILSVKEMRKIILEPSIDGLQKIIAIKKSSAFEMVRGVFLQLKNAGNDVSTRVENVITARYKELLNGVIKSGIQIRPKDVASPDSEEVKGLKEEMAKMQTTIDEMKKDGGGDDVETLKTQMADMQKVIDGMPKGDDDKLSALETENAQLKEELEKLKKSADGGGDDKKTEGGDPPATPPVKKK